MCKPMDRAGLGVSIRVEILPNSEVVPTRISGGKLAIVIAIENLRKRSHIRRRAAPTT